MVRDVSCHGAGGLSLQSGTPSSQLSSCFLMEAQDSMEDIGKALTDIMQLAKWEADFLAKLQDEDGGFYSGTRRQIAATQFSQVQAVPLTFGIVYLYTATRD